MKSVVPKLFGLCMNKAKTGWGHISDYIELLAVPQGK